MATTERARITGFFVIGFLVGLVTMWALVKGNTLKISADFTNYSRFDDCRREVLSNNPGASPLDAHVRNDLERCWAIYGASGSFFINEPIE